MASFEAIYALIYSAVASAFSAKLCLKAASSISIFYKIAAADRA
jgi:hypothetical protein